MDSGLDYWTGLLDIKIHCVCGPIRDYLIANIQHIDKIHSNYYEDLELGTSSTALSQSLHVHSTRNHEITVLN